MDARWVKPTLVQPSASPAPSLNRRGAKDSSTCKLLSLVILELLRFGFRTANGAQERLRAKGLRHGVSETIG